MTTATKEPLATLFCSMYSDTGRATHMLQRCGVGAEHVNPRQAASVFWTEAFALADRLGLLPSLVDLALSDKSVAAFHGALRAAWRVRENANEEARAEVADREARANHPGGCECRACLRLPRAVDASRTGLTEEQVAARDRLSVILPHLKAAAADAAESIPDSQVLLAVIAKSANGSGRITCNFESATFLSDLETLVLGAQ